MLFTFTLGCSAFLGTVLKNNPDIVFDVIKEHPYEFMKTLQKAGQEAGRVAQQKERENRMKNRVNPEVSSSRAFAGPENAPITIVEYSDFKCPFCSRGYQTVKQVMSAYSGKVRFVYKHFPIKSGSRKLALYYEAIALQSKAKAMKFHDKIFENQSKIFSDKGAYADRLVKSVGANLARVKKDIKTRAVQDVVDADAQEAQKFGVRGTPSFVVNGVMLKGAQPFPEFKDVIDKLLEGS